MKKKVIILGGGSCALFLAAELDDAKYAVSIYEKNSALGRKFLVAGDGGLNLTHSEAEKDFMLRYTPSGFLEKHFQRFSNQTFINWLNENGIATYIGSSSRVFPKRGTKPVDVLNKIIDILKEKKVSIHYKHEWLGFSENGSLVFKSNSQHHEVKGDIIVFCLGGASWPVTGSNGDWAKHFEKKELRVNLFAPSNCAFKVEWPKQLIPQIEGKALKNCKFTCGLKTHLGEAVLTSFGIEGSGVYPLSAELRQQLKDSGEAKLIVDFKPGTSEFDLTSKLAKINGKSRYTEHVMKELNLNRTHLALLKNATTREEFLDPKKMANTLKNFTITVKGTDAIENAISTVGGLDLSEITENFELKKMHHHFTIGEMLDFDAPTGGYLLQSCFTMAKSLATYLNSK